MSEDRYTLEEVAKFVVAAHLGDPYVDEECDLGEKFESLLGNAFRAAHHQVFIKAFPAAHHLTWRVQSEVENHDKELMRIERILQEIEGFDRDTEQVALDYIMGRIEARRPF